MPQEATAKAGEESNATTAGEQGQSGASSAPEEKIVTIKESELAKLLQAESDRVATKAIQTSKAKWEKEYAEKLEVEKAEAARLAKLSETERKEAELQKMREELEAERRQLKKTELEKKTIDHLLNQKLNNKLQKFVIADSEEVVIENIKSISEIIEEEVKNRIEQKFKDAGSSASKGAAVMPGKTEFTRDELKTKEGREAYLKTPGARIKD